MSCRTEKLIKEIFYNVQFNKTCHQSNLKKLRACYEKCEFTEFWTFFESCFKVPLSIAVRHPRVENTLEFVGKFAASFYSASEDNETEEFMCNYLSKLFDFVLENHSAKDPGVRFRLCHFLNILLNSLGDQAFINDDLCNRITASMMARLLDRSPKVRAQAVFALHRLQDPTDDCCPVIKMYIFHVSKDPKAEVRRAVLMSMGRNQRTLHVTLRRTRDVDERVRKAAYEFLNKITVRSLTISQRDQVLNDGLKDRSDMVRRSVENVLLPSWLAYFNGDFINLVKALDPEIGTDVSCLALQSLFMHSPLNTLLEQLPTDKNTKLIPLNDLTSENVLYWKCLVKYLQRESLTDELERVIPELSVYCTYINDFITSISAKQSEVWEDHMQKFILLQLFEIATTYDLADEVGRKNLHDLICDTLMSNYYSEKIIECIVSHLQFVVPNVNSRMDILTNVISEIRLPFKETELNTVSEEEQQRINLKRAMLKVKLLELKENEYEAIQNKQYLVAESLKNEIIELNNEILRLSAAPEVLSVNEELKEKDDPKTMIKCFSIICAMMQTVTTLTPTLQGLMQLALDSLDHLDDTVHIMALKVVSICCILDKELAKKHIMTLFLQFSLEQENPEIWIVVLQAIFDLILMYGLEHFDIVEISDETSKSHSVRLYNERDSAVSTSQYSDNSNVTKDNCNIIKILAGLLDNANEGLRTVATEGFCKLLLHRRVSGTGLLSKLIILCYNPANDNDFSLRQCLSVFFDNFVMHVPDAQEMLEHAYLPTLQILCNAPEISPLNEIDPYDVSRFILNMTRHVIKKNRSENYHAHNSLVFTILAELLNAKSKIDRATLVRSLNDLRIELDNMSKENLRQALDRVLEMLKDTNKRLLTYIQHFKAKLDARSTSDNAEDEESESDEG